MKRLILIGGGHSHVAVLKDFGAWPPASAELLLVSPDRHLLYSGMLPGLVAGHYEQGDCRIDLEPLAKAAGARFVRERVVAIDPDQREIVTGPGERIGYDFASLDIGSIPAASDIPGVERYAIGVRPFERFLSRWSELLAAAEGLRSIVVVGAGAAGVEILLAMQFRLEARGVREIQFLLLTGDARILTNHNDTVRAALERQLELRSVVIRPGCNPGSVAEGRLVLAGGESIAADAVVWATGPGAPPWISGTGLAVDAHGFLATNDRLQSLSHPEVFGSGDAATILDRPRPKSGVFAVRQGPVLARNLRLALSGAKPEPFEFSRHALALISCGARYAVGSWGRIGLEGEWVWRWKDRIDRRFVAQYVKTS